MNQNDLKEKLRSLGIEDDKIDKVIKDLSEMVVMEITKKYIASLSSQQLNLLKSIPESEIPSLIKKEKDKFPQFSPKEIEKIGNEVLEKYFQEMSK